MSPIEDDLLIVNRILHHRLQRDDIQEILSQLSDRDQVAFAEKVGRVLNRTSALLEVSRKVTEDLSLDKMLPKMVEVISDFIEAERATVFLHDQAHKELFSRVAQGELNFEIRLSDESGLVGDCFHRGESFIVNDPYSDPRFNAETDLKSGFRTRSVLCSPIIHKGGVIGVLQVLNRRSGQFDQADVMTLEAIAQHASLGFENARLYDQVNRARSKEQRLFDVTTALSQELQLKPLLIKVMEAVTSFLDADRSTLFLYDEKSGELWSQVAQGTSEIRFQSHLGIAGSVFMTGEVVNISDAYQDDRFNPSFDQKTGYLTRSILCIPIMNKASARLGVIQVINKNEGTFTSADERSLRAFAAQASIAIENAQLFEQVMAVKRYNEAVLESMSNGVLTLDPRGRVVTANRSMTALLGGEAVVSAIKSQDVKYSFMELCQAHIPWLAQLITEVQERGVNRDDEEHINSFDRSLDLDSLISSLPLEDIPKVEKRSVNITAMPLVSSSSSESGTLLLFEDMSNEKRMRSTMSRYLPSEVADQLLRDGGEALGGSLQEATVLFSDIRSFTTISEKIGAQETVQMLNDYFGVMVDVISDHHGILDKFIGDAIMAVFGAPLPSEHDADNAVTAAVEMLRALDRLNDQRAVVNKPKIRIGIGLNTGEVLSGNIGSSKRMDYTVIGDAVNLAARLESATKGYRAQLLISEFTASKIKRSHELREVDLLRVKGKQQPVRVYEVVTHTLERVPQMSDLFAHYEEGLLRYRRGDWSGARDRFLKASNGPFIDPLSQRYVERCEYFIAQPPSIDWDGVWVMQSK